MLIALGPLVLGALHLLFRRTRWGILVMNRGELIARGTPAAVAADPLVREVYLGGGGV